MTEVKRSTSQADDVSRAEGYDLRSWQGLTAVLKRAREADLDSPAYDAFRDMVLSYAQSGGDPTLRAKIDTIIAAFKIPEESSPETKPSSDEAEQQAQAPGKLRVGRPMPTFAPPAAPAVPEVHVHEIPHSESVAIPEPAPPPPPIPTPEVTPIVSEPEPIPVEVRAEEEKEVPHKSIEAHKARIAEIKRIVHSTFGNPVTLMDAGNGAGRSYMNALLTAMKATGGGSPVNIDGAMQKLEEAFLEIEALGRTADVAPPQVTEPVVLEAAETTTQPKIAEDIPVVPETEQVAVPTIEPEVMEAPTTPDEVAAETPAEVLTETENEVLAALRDPVPQDTPSAEDVFTDVPFMKSGVDADTPPAETPTSSLTSVLDRIMQTSAERLGKRVQPENEDPMRWSRQENESVAIHSPEPTHVQEAQPEPVLSPGSSVPENQLIRAEARSDLDTPEINASLNQLLHEWKLFRSSGVFGLGSSGREHPLYKTLEQLPMLTLVNGEWEGAKLEEKQSIRDYINAWRHEQGVTYNPTETFDRYLRRVVQKVLKRQKDSLGA